MAAPTVGAVMADILPYLEVKRNWTEADAAGREVTVEDFTGLTLKEAQTQLKQGESIVLFFPELCCVLFNE